MKLHGHSKALWGVIRATQTCSGTQKAILCPLRNTLRGVGGCLRQRRTCSQQLGIGRMFHEVSFVEIIHLNFRLPPLTMDWRIVEAPKTIKVVDRASCNIITENEKGGIALERLKKEGEVVISSPLYCLSYYCHGITLHTFVATEIRLGAALRRANPLRRTLPHRGFSL